MACEGVCRPGASSQVVRPGKDACEHSRPIRRSNHLDGVREGQDLEGDRHGCRTEDRMWKAKGIRLSQGRGTTAGEAVIAGAGALYGDGDNENDHSGVRFRCHLRTKRVEASFGLVALRSKTTRHDAIT
jgi:hypothetical protein